MHKHFPKFIPKIQKYPKNHQKSWNFEQNYIIFSKFPPPKSKFSKKQNFPTKISKIIKKITKIVFFKIPKKMSKFPRTYEITQKILKIIKKYMKIIKNFPDIPKKS